MITRDRGRTWRKTRERIMSRDCGLCQVCLKEGNYIIGKEVDHIVPLFKGGTDSDDNLQTICTEHHAEKTAHDLGKKRRKAIGLDGWPIG